MKMGWMGVGSRGGGVLCDNGIHLLFWWLTTDYDRNVFTPLSTIPADDVYNVLCGNL